MTDARPSLLQARRRTPPGVPVVVLVDQALAHGDLFSAGYKNTIAVIRPDGSVKRTPTIRVQSAIFTRFMTRGAPDGRAEIAHAGDRWMTEKIDAAIDTYERTKNWSRDAV